RPDEAEGIGEVARGERSSVPWIAHGVVDTGPKSRIANRQARFEHAYRSCARTGRQRRAHVLRAVTAATDCGQLRIRIADQRIDPTSTKYLRGRSLTVTCCLDQLLYGWRARKRFTRDQAGYLVLTVPISRSAAKNCDNDIGPEAANVSEYVRQNGVPRPALQRFFRRFTK